ncbi:MAG: MBL fold metallo-hydrolase [Oscillospiraceae bacterium]|nr:MBL fold metallo-hydrolase [Oscillospiraceae bacterium]
MKVYIFIKGELATNTYFCVDESTNEAIVIDPGMRGDLIYEKAAGKSLNIKLILLTHAHFDHAMGCKDLIKLSGAKLAVHYSDEELLADSWKNYADIYFGQKVDDYPYVKADILFKDGDEFVLGKNVFKVMHTPGHTMGSCVFICDNMIFSGDTLFSEGAGRTDLYGGDAAMMEVSLKKLSELKGEYKILPGHGRSRTVNFDIT